MLTNENLGLGNMSLTLTKDEVLPAELDSVQDDTLLRSVRDEVLAEDMSSGLSDIPLRSSGVLIESGNSDLSDTIIVRGLSKGKDAVPVLARAGVRKPPIAKGRGGHPKEPVDTTGTIDNPVNALGHGEEISLQLELQRVEADQPRLQVQPIMAVRTTQARPLALPRPKPKPNIPALLLPAQETLRCLIEAQLQAGDLLDDNGIIHHGTPTLQTPPGPKATLPSLSSRSPSPTLPRKIFPPAEFYQLCRQAYFVSQEFDCSLGGTTITSTTTTSSPLNPSPPHEELALSPFVVRNILSSPHADESTLATLMKLSYLALTTSTSSTTELLEFYDSLLVTTWATLGTHPSALSAFNPLSIGPGFIENLPSILDRVWARDDSKHELASEISALVNWGREWWATVHYLLRKENKVLASAGVRWQIGVLWTIDVLETMKRFAGRGMGVEQVWRRVVLRRRESGAWREFVGGNLVFVVGKEDLESLYVR